METGRKRILIVDDSPFDISFVVNTLQSHYAIQVATNGKKAVEIANSTTKPDLILMDVQMPEMSGFEACQIIKNDFETENIDIIFLSGLNSTEEKLKGYDSGGCDFISKPIEPQELLKKISIAIKKRSQRNELLEEKNSIFNTAMTAITSAGEIGVVLEFTRKLFSITSPTALANEVISCLSSLDLNASVALLTDNDPIFASNINPMSNLEQNLLVQLQAAERIYEKGRRMMFNLDGVNLIIKNAPEDDDKRGRYRDIIAMMMNSVAACHKRLQFDQQLKILSMDAKNELKKVAQKRSKHLKEGDLILQTLLKDLEKSFMAWGLAEEQEVILTEMVHKAIDALDIHNHEGKQLESGLQDITNRLLAIRPLD